MALNLADRVRETTTVTGTGPATLLGAVQGYQAFSVVGNTNICYYTIADQQGSNWEVGIGTYSTTGPTLTRTTVLASSNGGSAVNFTTGTKDIFLTQPSEKAVYLDDSSYLVGNGSYNITLNGNLTFNGTAKRITADMSTATIANRLAFQTSTTNGNTALIVLPNGTSQVARYQAYNNADPTNASQGQFSVETTSDVRITSSITGSGTYLPITMWTSGAEKFRIAADATGTYTFGGTAPRITGDFTGTVANRVLTQTSTVDSPTNFGIIPNGSSTSCLFAAFNNSTPTNSSVAQLWSTSTEISVRSAISGSGTYLPLTIYTNNTEKFRIAADTTGTFTFGGTGPRITGDFSNATIASRVIFQTSSTNLGTTLTVIPNGASNTAQLQVQNSSSDLVNYSYGLFRVDATTVQVRSDIGGTGTYLPTTFWTGGSERIRINTSGNLLLGTTTTPASNAVKQVITGGTSNYLEFISTSGTGGIIGNLGAALTFFTLTGSIGSETYTERMRIDGNGLVGIGLTPSGTAVQLQVSSDALISGLTVGKGTGAVATNTALGVNAIGVNTTGQYNTATGWGSLQQNTTGSQNSAFGMQSLYSNTTASNNTAVGFQAAYLNATGTPLTFIGTFAGYSTTTGPNTGVGYASLYSNTTGTNNVAIGCGTNIPSAALGSNTTGTDNTATGFGALGANTTGASNTAYGSSSLKANTTGNYSVAIGANSLLFNTTSSGSVAVGVNSLYYSTGVGNTALGYVSGQNITTGTYNTGLGYSAGFGITTGVANIAVGSAAPGYNGPMGNGSVVTGSHNIAMGAAVMQNLTSGNYNIGLGYQNCLNLTTGSYNTGIGITALASLTTGSYNVAIGSNALLSTTSSQNTAVGYQAGYANTTGSITSVGYQAGYANTTGISNVAFGVSSLSTNTTGNYNTAIGHGTLLSSNATGNTALGFATMNAVTSGNYNVGVGYGCLVGITNTSGNIGIGQGAGGGLTTGSFNVYIGYGSTASSSSAGTELLIAPNPNSTAKGSNTGFIDVGAAGSVYQGNNNASWATTSDIRIKENVSDVASGLDVITALRPVQFDYILTGQHDTGFIAQEYQKVLPDQVTTHTATGKEVALTGGEDLLAINQNLVPYLVKAVQELKAEVDSLKKQLGK